MNHSPVSDLRLIEVIEANLAVLEPLVETLRRRLDALQPGEQGSAAGGRACTAW